jgi:hypothetical protein
MIVVAWNQRTLRVIEIIDAETERGKEREENKRACKEGKARKGRKGRPTIKVKSRKQKETKMVMETDEREKFTVFDIQMH